MISNHLQAGEVPNTDSVLLQLTTQFREYKRTSQADLRRVISTTITQARNVSRAVSAVSGAASHPLEQIAADEKEKSNHSSSETTSSIMSLNDGLYAATRSNAAAALSENIGDASKQLEPTAAAAATSSIGGAAGQKRKRTGGGGGGSKRRGGGGEGEGAGNPELEDATNDDGMGGGKSSRMMQGFQLSAAIRPEQRYGDLGGMQDVLKTVRDVIEYPLQHPEVYLHLGVSAPRGVLLHGPPGVGKTLLAHAIAGQLGVYFRAVAAPELVGSLSGESEQRLRSIFDDAAEHAPAILFIDEIDAIAPRRDSTQRGMERRIVSQLLACMDGLSLEKTGGKPVIVMAATNRPDSIDTSLRRTGRFDREISLPIPDESARVEILKVLTRRMRIASTPEIAFDFLSIARSTPGYVGADLASLTKEAAACAINRALLSSPRTTTTTTTTTVSASLQPNSLETATEDVSARMAVVEDEEKEGIEKPSPPYSASELEHVSVIFADFEAATKIVQPSALREGFATVPSVTWDDVGALKDVGSELEMAIVQPLKRPEVFAALNLRVPAGVLLYGPPGCGKTLIAKAIANETSANFISVKGPELLDKYVGESERAVRQLFQRARASAPCIVFFDELDSLAPRRGGGEGSGGGGSSGSSGVSERVVNQLLTEMDGLESRRDVFVIAATNRPDIIDPAMLRPGRLDKLLYVPLPTPLEREQILKTQTRSTPLSSDVVIATIAADERCNRFSGADLAALVREASVASLHEYFTAEEGLQDAAIASGTSLSISTTTTTTSTSSSESKKSSRRRFGSVHPVAEGVAGDDAVKPNSSSVLPSPIVCHRHFLAAFAKVSPSVSVADERQYNSLRTKLRSTGAAKGAVD